MSVMVRFGRRVAFLRRGEWVCADRELEARLNRAMNEWIQETGGPPFDDRDQERTAAKEMAARFGGHIVRRVRPPRSRTAQEFLARRQMEFPFSAGGRRQ